jgi:hypothetical protein
MKNMKLKFALAGSLAMILLSCSTPERDNVFDPGSPDYKASLSSVAGSSGGGTSEGVSSIGGSSGTTSSVVLSSEGISSSSSVESSSSSNIAVNINTVIGLDANTIGLWKFDEGSGASIANAAGGSAGTLNGGYSWINGVFGKGVQFNGLSGYANLNFNPPW